MFEHLVDRIRRSRERARATRQLYAMSPRQLRDIGVEPGQIEDYVAGRLPR